MKLSLRFVCPKCGHHFPFFIGYSRTRVRSGLLSAPWFRCPECECLSHQHVAWLHALWAWPLALLMAGSIIALFRNISPFVELHHNHPGLYGALAGVSFAPVFFLVRLGLRLEPLFETQTPAHSSIRPTVLSLVFIAAACVAVGFVTHRWLGSLVGLVIGLAVWTPFYVFAKKRDGGSVEPESGHVRK